MLAALPLATGSAAMASVGAGAKGTAAAKSGLLATLSAPLIPFLGVVAGVFAQCLIIQNTTNDRKLRVKLMAQVVVYWIGVIGAAWGGEAAVRGLANHFSWSDQQRFVSLSLFWWGYCCLLLALMWFMAQRNMSFGRLQKPPANEPSHSHARPGNWQSSFLEFTLQSFLRSSEWPASGMTHRARALFPLQCWRCLWPHSSASVAKLAWTP